MHESTSGSEPLREISGHEFCDHHNFSRNIMNVAIVLSKTEPPFSLDNETVPNQSLDAVIM